jgi:uncharacterized protein YfkK (UPF0435 family)
MSAGKGDKPRKVDGEKYRSNYDKIFRKDNFSPSEMSKAAKKQHQKK